MKLSGLCSSIHWQLLLQIIQLSFCFSLPGAGNETDRLSLLAFKDHIIDDPLRVLSSWNESLPFCEWFGVTCGRKHQRVVGLNLHSSQLVGSLSPHIGNLSFLRILNLENNSFSHYIPQEFGRLSRLQQLRLGNNTFISGEIPVNISLCSDLLFLNLQSNNLTGKIPSELGFLSKLQVFVFEYNNLVGEIPPSFGNLSSVEKIYGAVNNLQGGIPSSIGLLKQLKDFNLGVNNLSGAIPPSIYNLSSLIFLSFPLNQLYGRLPPDLGLTLPNLEFLQIHTNFFSGPIPSTLSNVSNITYLDMSFNNFTGKVPTLASTSTPWWFSLQFNNLGDDEDDDLSFLHPLANKTSLEVLAVNENNFGGKLPKIVSNFSTNLRQMFLGGNRIRGTIPTDIGNLVSLDMLALEYNQLSGIIPNSIGKLQNLVALYLNGNKISGIIPSSLGNITSLAYAYLEQNNLHGSIPSSLGKSQNLVSLFLSKNNLSGPIPKEVMAISSLSKYLDLSGNRLTGSLPSEVGKLANLGFLIVSHNRLSGEIPRSLGSCISLEHLYMEGNFFQGSIPESLNSLKALQNLNLSYNNLTGHFPEFLEDLKLLTGLDLSFNDLEGEVPMQGVFQNASAVSLWGNKKLCGGIPQLNLSRCASNDSTKMKSSTKLIWIIAIPCCFLGIILISSLLVYHCRKTKNLPAIDASWEISFRRVAYEELFQATGEFSSSNLIGAGTFGSVYKGILASDGTTVAVKVFNLLRKGASKSFMAECAALINIRHRNLLKVLSACSSIDFQGNDFKALVYEFMVNGSLEEWLYPVQTTDEEHEPRYLNLIKRLNIAIDIATAVDYLHHHCQMAVVHCDLKPSNILLDGDMTAHVGDFGLARLRPEHSHQQSSDHISSIGLKGTIGYAAPEYGIGSEVSIYGDVYSYGILLLEMFTGKRPTDSLFKDGLNLHNYAKTALTNNVFEVVDPILLRKPEENCVDASQRMKKNIEVHNILECLICIIKVGVACSVEFPRERMDSSNVVAELHRIRGILFETRKNGQHEILELPEGV